MSLFFHWLMPMSRNFTDDDQRVLLLLVSVEGLSYQEVADTLGIKIGTVMSRLSRARKALRALNDGTTITPSLRILK